MSEPGGQPKNCSFEMYAVWRWRMLVYSGVGEGIRGYTPYDHLQKFKKSVIRSMTTSNNKKVVYTPSDNLSFMLFS